jgi:hypothetical protein
MADEADALTVDTDLLFGLANGRLCFGLVGFEFTAR